MKKIKILSIAVLIFSIMISVYMFTGKRRHNDEEREDRNAPSDWFYTQRAFPNKEIPFEKYFEAMDKKQQMQSSDNSSLTLNWIARGPSNIGGRITAIAVDPGNSNTIIIGAAAGGIFKTTNGGTNWTPKTDNFPSLSVGSLMFDPNNPNVLFCGTGEANSAIDVYPGFGLLKSTDKGDSWALIGLNDALHIGALDIHPLNSSLMYSAVLGYRSFSQNKGIYKSTNGGANWQRSLFVSDSTSGIDVKVSPDDQNLVYAAMWERVRTPPSISKTGGITSGLYRSSNGGANWLLLGTTNGLPAPDVTTGRISIAVSRTNPNYVYSIFRTTNGNNISAVYKSTNKGLVWTSMPLNGVESSGFDWYFGLIEVAPNDPNTVFIGSIDLFKTTNGSSWVNLTNAYSQGFDQQHPDQHVLWINPANTSQLINGNDGGIFISSNSGTSWIKKYDLPITQFYGAAIDYLQPQRKIGGAQDNGSSISFTGAPDNWQVIYGGDGFNTLIDYTNSNIIYCEYQNGGLGRSDDNGVNFNDITSGLSGRFNWSTPYIMDIQTPATIYVGSNFIFKSTNKGDVWTQISPDLTRGPNGRLGTITCITSAVLPTSQRVIYVGTDDAKVSVTTNSGTNWTDVTGSLPQRYVTDVLCDKNNPAIAYVTLSGFNIDEKNTHIYRTANYGANWTNISGNLLNVPANSIIIDYNRDSVLYAGCDAGVFYTTNLGTSWNLLGTGLPNSPVLKLNFHQPSMILVAATHGRSQYEADVSVLPIGIEPNSEIAAGFSLSQNYPNPFNPATRINFSIPKAMYISLIVYDIAGRQAGKIYEGNLNKGLHEAVFNGENLSSGIYFYSLKTEGYSETKKMILLK